MTTGSILSGFLLWVIYPAWLVAGFFDYLSHRRTRIELTSGAQESWLHVAQFLSLGLALALAAHFHVTPYSLALIGLAVLLHTGLAVVDVGYTYGRREIRPFEQHVHGFLVVLPIVAVCVLGIAHSQGMSAFEWFLQPRMDSDSRVKAAWLMASYLVLAGVPLFEELVRTSRGLRHHQVEHDDERPEGHHA